MEQQVLKNLIRNGKLKTYNFGGGFISIYWQTDTLPEGTYYLFKFTEFENKLVDIKTVSPSFIPVKYKARKYNSMMFDLMISLIKKD